MPVFTAGLWGATLPYASLPLILWGVILGAAVGAVMSVFARRSQGRLVLSLKNAGAFTPETAVSLADVALDGDFLLRLALKPGKALTRYVKEQEGRYYLPDETRYTAEIRYDLKGTDVRGLILGLVLLALLGVAMQLAAPYITDFITDTVSGL